MDANRRTSSFDETADDMLRKIGIELSENKALPVTLMFIECEIVCLVMKN